jgi:phospholipase/carboxylesterase
VEVGWPVSRDVPLESVLIGAASPVAPPRAPGAPPLTEAADPEQAGEPLPDGVEGVQAREHRVAGLYVLEVVLGHVPFDAELPLVVMLHGRGDRPRVPGGPFAGAPTPMRLILPRAPKPLGSGFTWLPLSVTENRADVMADTLRRRADQLAQVIAHFRTLRPSQGKVIVAGFSQGAMLTYSLAMLHPEHVDVALPIAGWLPPPLVPDEVPPVRRVPIRAIHGDADPVVRIEPTRQLVERLRGLGYEVEWVEEPGAAHVVSPTMNAQFERWLEAALERLAPGLSAAGQGLGEAGTETVTYAPWVALDTPTIEAIQEAEQEAAASEAAGETPAALEENGATPSEGSNAPEGSAPPSEGENGPPAGENEQPPVENAAPNAGENAAPSVGENATPNAAPSAGENAAPNVDESANAGSANEALRANVADEPSR